MLNRTGRRAPNMEFEAFIQNYSCSNSLLDPSDVKSDPFPADLFDFSACVANKARFAIKTVVEKAVGADRVKLDIGSEKKSVFEQDIRLAAVVAAFEMAEKFGQVLVRIWDDLWKRDLFYRQFFAFHDLFHALRNEVEGPGEIG